MNDNEILHSDRSLNYLDSFITLCKELDIHSDLDIELDNIPVHLKARGDSATLSFDKFGDIFAFARLIKRKYIIDRSSLHSFKELFNKLGITLYLHNHYFGLIGPKSGVIFPSLFKFATPSVKRE